MAKEKPTWEPWPEKGTGVWKPKTNSQSPIEEQLAEYRLTSRNQEAEIRIDRRDDPLIYWKPVPYDPRFPNTNITKYCYTMYKDFFKCQKYRGPDYEPCEYFRHAYTGICPSAWTESWDEQREQGLFAGLVEPEERKPKWKI